MSTTLFISTVVDDGLVTTWLILYLSFLEPFASVTNSFITDTVVLLLVIDAYCHNSCSSIILNSFCAYVELVTQHLRHCCLYGFFLHTDRAFSGSTSRLASCARARAFCRASYTRNRPLIVSMCCSEFLRFLGRYLKFRQQGPLSRRINYNIYLLANKASLPVRFENRALNSRSATPRWLYACCAAGTRSTFKKNYLTW